MSALTYFDFDLQIDEATDAQYRVRVLSSPVGQAEALFELPFSELEIDNFLLRISGSRRSVRRINSAEMEEARKFGSKLYEAVFQGEIQTCFLRSIDHAEQLEQGIRLRLRLPPSLIELPWEYLYDVNDDRFLSHSTSTPIVRFLDLSERLKTLTVTPPLNVLVMMASPQDYALLNVEAEWQKLKTAVATLEQRGLLHLARLPASGQAGATLAALQAQLRQERYHVFHFIGHGGFDEQTQDGVLLLEGDDGRSRLVSGNYLGTLLHDEPSLRLALLNACEGARTSRADPFAGVAQQLVRQGIPAVIAMQVEITDEAAIQLTREFYGALVDGYPVEGALAEARKALFTAGNDVEWGAPVLYLRSPDGHLFDVALQTQIPPTEPGAMTIDASTAVGASSDSVAQPTTPKSFSAKWRRWWPIALLVAVFVVIGGIWIWMTDVSNRPRQAPAAPQAAATRVTATAASDRLGTPAASSIDNIEPISRTLWLIEAQKLVEDNDYTAAILIYEQLIKVNPEDVEAILGLAWVLRNTAGREQDALRLLNQAVALQPNNPAVNAALGDILRETFDRSAEAIDYYTRDYKHNPRSARESLRGTGLGLCIGWRL
ncbi:MAG: CHAT domain-containing protein [Caldilineaceae bacterium]